MKELVLFYKDKYVIVLQNTAWINKNNYVYVQIHDRHMYYNEKEESSCIFDCDCAIEELNQTIETLLKDFE